MHIRNRGIRTISGCLVSVLGELESQYHGMKRMHPHGLYQQEMCESSRSGVSGVFMFAEAVCLHALSMTSVLSL